MFPSEALFKYFFIEITALIYICQMFTSIHSTRVPSQQIQSNCPNLLTLQHGKQGLFLLDWIYLSLHRNTTKCNTLTYWNHSKKKKGSKINSQKKKHSHHLIHSVHSCRHTLYHQLSAIVCLKTVVQNIQSAEHCIRCGCH